MSRLRLVNIRAGQSFYEVDHGVAVQWQALQDAQVDKRGDVSLLCERRPGIQMVFHEFSSNQSHRTPLLYNYIDVKQVSLIN